jgi:hypothetical protein
MSYGKYELVRKSGRWASAVASAVKEKLEDVAPAFAVEMVDFDSSTIQRDIRIRSRDTKAPSLVITCEESQAFLAIDRVPGTSVLYEFLGEPETLAQRLAQHDSRQILADAGMSEIDLIDHVAGFATSGYAFSRILLYERLNIKGAGTTPDLKWINIDLDWPPVFFSCWRPS